MTQGRSIEILMVDDDELDYELFVRQLKKQRIANPVHWAQDGVQALEFLEKWYAQEPSAKLIVLMDINMPRMDGLECVRRIRANDVMKSTVVFVLTTSSHEKDIHQAYDVNVAGYLVKGDLGPAFIDGIMMLDSYWKIVELPN